MAWYPCLYNSGGGGGSTLGEKTISTYGVYNASDDSLDGYSKVTNVTGLETATASGAVASISDAVAMPCPSVVAQIVPVQAGSGTPSHDNVRTLSGWSSANLTRDQGTGTTPTIWTVNFGGTYYKGYHDFVSGTFVATHAAVDLSTLDWIATGSGTSARWRSPDLASIIKIPSYNSEMPDLLMEKFSPINAGASLGSYPDRMAILVQNSPGHLITLKYDDNKPSGLCVFALATPTTFSITPQTITTAQGVNNFYADTGDTSVTYYRVATGDSYLYNTDPVYINTGYIHKANTKLVLDCEPWRDAGGYAVICGARAGSYRDNAMLFFGKFNGNRYGWSRTGQEEVTDYWNNFSGNYAWYDVRCVVTMEGNTCTVLNVASRETRTITCTNATVNDGIAPIALFCDNNSSSADGFAAQDWSMMKFYSLKIYESDVLVHNFVPAYNNNQYCIYDLVDQVYKYDLYDSGRYLNGYISSHEPEPEPVKIERLFYFEGDQDDDVRIPTALTLDEDTNFSTYLSYDTTTNKFTVLKAFSALVTGWVYQFQSASGYGTGQFVVNSVAKMTYQVPSTSSGSKGGTTGVFDFAVGDTFWPYQNSSSGWPQQFLKVYLVKNLDFTDVIELDDETT